MKVEFSSENNKSEKKVEVFAQKFEYDECDGEYFTAGIYGIDGTLYTDNDYAYYMRDADTANGVIYHSTFRFYKQAFSQALTYILENGPLEFEEYMQTLDGYEWIEYDRYE